MVLLDEGLAAQNGDAWHFVCPAVWGNSATDSDKTPLARSIDGRDSWLIGDDDLYLGRDGSWQGQQRPDLTSAAVVALAADEDALYGLRLDAEGSSVLRLDDAAHDAGNDVLYESENYWSALAADPTAGRLYLARTTELPALVVLVLDRQGERLEEREIALPAEPQRVRLRPTPAGLFAVLYTDAQYELAAIDTSFEVLAQSISPIRGPLTTADGTLWIAVDGELQRRTAADFEATGEVREITCLESWGSTAYACAGTELYRLDGDGLSERLFALDGIGPPLSAWVPPVAERDCHLQWILYRTDIERIGLTPGDDAETGTAEPAAGTTPVPVAPSGQAGTASVSTGDAAPPVASGPSGDGSSGCSVVVGAAAGGRAPGVLGCATLACLALALRRRPHATSRSS